MSTDGPATVRVTAGPPTLGDRIVVALGQAGVALLETDKAKIEAALHAIDYQVAAAIVTTVERDFPRQSIEERAVEGPILALLTRAQPDIVADLDGAGAAAIAAIESALTGT